MDADTVSKQRAAASEAAKKATETPGESSAEGKKANELGQSPDKPLYVQTTPSGWAHALEAAGPAAEGLGDAFLIVVLVVFMLIQRENLRNRLVRLVGHGRLIVTTQAFDEGAQRISRYLLMQLAINTIFGVTLAVGLFATGSDHAANGSCGNTPLLWGFIAAVLRFVPYVGTWIAAALDHRLQHRHAARMGVAVGHLRLLHRH